jgi:hypothetical protein
LGSRLHSGRVEEVRRESDGYVLDLAVPFAARDDIQLSQRADELTIQVGLSNEKLFCPVFWRAARSRAPGLWINDYLFVSATGRRPLL